MTKAEALQIKPRALRCSTGPGKSCMLYSMKILKLISKIILFFFLAILAGVALLSVLYGLKTRPP